MHHESIVGRHAELQILKQIYESHEPQFVALYGRRRIGKTFLISEFFKYKGVYFEITGIKNGPISQQLHHFSYEFSRQFIETNRMVNPTNWVEAFHLLNDAIEKVANDKKIILFFDEIPWLASQKSGFLGALEHFWNRYASRNKNIILVVCGSAAAWIIKNIIHNRGGLHGRVTKQIPLYPFTLTETEQYLESRGINLDRKQIIDIYMAIGGVPKYLAYIERGKSAAQNINNICFSFTGGLNKEFDELYQSLFDNYAQHVSIVKALAHKKNGLTKNALLQAVKMPSGGTSSKMIQELVDSGFIMYIPPFGKKKVGGIYRLIDEYSLFYLTWIVGAAGVSIGSVDSEYWMKKYGTSAWNAWSGCAFESLCLKHVHKIKEALGISGIDTVDSGWRYIPAPGSDTQGAQIDLVIDRADRCMNLCEMKYSESEFVIEKEYAAKLQTKKHVFRQHALTKKTLFMTMITPYGVKKNAPALGVVDNELTLDALFSSLHSGLLNSW